MFILPMLAIAAAGLSPAFTSKPCADPWFAKVARCGEVVVPEDRSRPEGRTIALNVIVLPGKAPTLPPLFDIDGGPGLPATKNAEFYLNAGSAYRADRDIVLVDQRGTGRSNPLHCPQFAAAEAALQPLYPPRQVAECRAQLERKADLKLYGTREAIADLDAVRGALGHPTIDIFGLSYGTTVALRYMAAYPQRVRAAVLMGVAPASARPPSGHAAAADRALGLLSAQCAADSACAAAFDPAADLARALARLPSIPGAPVPEVFTEKLRSVMYQPSGARRLPLILAQAAKGNLAPFYAAARPTGPSLYADGMHLSVTCSEGIALIDYASAAADARQTRFGDYRLRRQRDACFHWPTGTVDPDHLSPVRSQAQVLLISGGLDPVTPPQWAAEAARHLPNSRHVIIESGGHMIDGLAGIDSCFDPLVVKFLATANARSLDTGCVAGMTPPPFLLEEPAVKAAR